jgi:hypothetical protein
MSRSCDKRLKRGSATSGKEEHVELVKLATKKIVDTFQNLRVIHISYEQFDMQFEISIAESRDRDYTNTYFTLRPDIMVRAENRWKEHQPWLSIMDSNAIVFEAETDPKNIFSNVLKMEAFKKIKSDSYGRIGYAFVLVCWEDAALPQNIEPFDEVWKFPRD